MHNYSYPMKAESIARHKYPPSLLHNLSPVPFQLARADPNEIKYVLHSINRQISEGDSTYATVEIDLTAALCSNELDSSSQFRRDLPMKIFLHGYGTSPALSPWYPILRDEYFLRNHTANENGVNILYVDWSKPANRTLFVAMANVHPVGEFIADFLLTCRYPPENLHIIGHSLGGQLAGFIGKFIYRKTGTTVNRITALDPAGPCFGNPLMRPDDRLNANDAQFVDVVHSDIDYYGYSAPLGHVDFYANGGTNQPSCRSPDSDDNCNHAKSTHYYIDSINNLECSCQRAEYRNGRIVPLHDDIMKNLDEIVIFGDKVDRSVRGVFTVDIVETKPYPYLREDNEIR